MSHAPAIASGSPLIRNAAALRGIVRVLRPHQWVKNLLVFAGVVFSQSLFVPEHLAQASLAFLCFCLASSAVYVFNDWRDRAEDRLHPQKCRRPLAAGTIQPVTAVVLSLGLGFLALSLAVQVRVNLGLVLAVYLVLNLAYCLGLKTWAILDVMAIAVGFVLRAVAGAAALGMGASTWIMLCTFTLALLVGFGKRRHELVLLQGDAEKHRKTLHEYTPQLLDALMIVSGACALVTYALYTMAEVTTTRFGTHSLVLTVPFVMYGVFRYYLLVYQKTEGGDPARLFVTDPPMLVNGLLWVLAICTIVYGPDLWWALW